VSKRVNTVNNNGVLKTIFQDASEQSVEDCPQCSSQESPCPAVFVSISLSFSLSLSEIQDTKSFIGMVKEVFTLPKHS